MTPGAQGGVQLLEFHPLPLDAKLWDADSAGTCSNIETLSGSLPCMCNAIQPRQLNIEHVQELLN
eukprot:2966356-Amphidinium_carterae.1